METKVSLRDGTEVTIRAQTQDDVDRSVAFFESLPAEDSEYLRGDVAQRHLLEERIRNADPNTVRRLVAEADGRIVADGALELGGQHWREHRAELRLIVARDYQRQGLGLLLVRELYALASALEVEDLVVKMMRPQVAAHAMVRKLGFHEEVLLPDYVKDAKGRRQDMVLMVRDLKTLSKKIEELLADPGWRRPRRDV